MSNRSILWALALSAALLAGPLGAEEAESWGLAKIVHGDQAVDPSGDVEFELVHADARGGEVRLRVPCEHEPRHMPEYVFRWELDVDVTTIARGQGVVLSAEGERVDELGTACPPGAWTPSLTVGVDLAGLDRLYTIDPEDDAGQGFDLEHGFGAPPADAVVPEMTGEGSTTGQASLTVSNRAPGLFALQLRLRTGVSTPSVAYVFRAEQAP